MSALRLHLRTRAALTLTKMMHNERLRVGKLSELAGVSENYIRYLYTFAQDHKQIKYLCSKVSEYSHEEYLNLVTVNISMEDYELLSSLEGSLSGHIQKAYRQWRKKNGYHSGRD